MHKNFDPSFIIYPFVFPLLHLHYYVCNRPYHLFLISSIAGAIDPSLVLEQIEVQISTVKEEAFSRKDILERVEKWLAASEEESWLEEYSRVRHLINCAIKSPYISATTYVSLYLYLRMKTDTMREEVLTLHSSGPKKPELWLPRFRVIMSFSTAL